MGSNERILQEITEGVLVYLKKLVVQNFRLLQDVELYLDEKSTLIVGRNNSGKTSLTELFRRLTENESPRFRLEDFSLGVHRQFWIANELRKTGADEEEVRAILPSIEVVLTIDYSKPSHDLGALSPFVIDLDVKCTEAKISVEYAPKNGQISMLLADLPTDRGGFFKELKERIPALYGLSVEAQDPTDESNVKSVELSQLHALLNFRYINAQRVLDDTSRREKAVLGKILEALFVASIQENADPHGRNRADQLKEAVSVVQDSIDHEFNTQLLALIPAFELFGYPGLADPRLRTETTLKVETLLSNHTVVTYEGADGVNLPESYNGLGPRNLIYILLKLLEYFRAYLTMEPAPLGCIFIEEPEAHLHPQMQSVFIRKLSEIAKLFGEKYDDGRLWPVQFVVTTHSSHVANEAPFESMRYFLARPSETQPGVYVTKVRDLCAGLGAEDPADRDFLHKYMTLTRCDLLFADRSILVEGATERLLLPRMIEKIDDGQPAEEQLGSQYVSIMEVGGAYAHIFFTLLDFLELRTLVITDLDTIDASNGRRKCRVSQGTHSSNACIKRWYSSKERGEPSKVELFAKDPGEKVVKCRRIAFQIPQIAGDACGRSFEDAFMLANCSLFGIDADLAGDREERAWQKARDVDKTAFALKYAISETGWLTPRYIEEGLRWLAKSPTTTTTVVEAPPEHEPSAITLGAEDGADG